MKQKIIYIISISLSIFILFFIITCSWIGFEVKNQCENAMQKYNKKDCITALSLVLENKNENYKSKNDAIWTMGQIGDKKALNTLNKYYTGIIPEKEPYNKMISQYELKKALNLVNGGFNITKFFRIN